jgi:hypothetical protein
VEASGLACPRTHRGWEALDKDALCTARVAAAQLPHLQPEDDVLAATGNICNGSHVGAVDTLRRCLTARARVCSARGRRRLEQNRIWKKSEPKHTHAVGQMKQVGEVHARLYDRTTLHHTLVLTTC